MPPTGVWLWQGKLLGECEMGWMCSVTCGVAPVAALGAGSPGLPGARRLRLLQLLLHLCNTTSQS